MAETGEKGKSPELLSAVEIAREGEIQGVYNAFNYVFDLVKNEQAITGADVFEINRFILQKTQDAKYGGEIREDNVLIRVRKGNEIVVSKVKPPDFEDLPYLFADYCEILSEKATMVIDQPKDKPLPTSDIIDYAVWAHQELIKIHPFDEGNGRTARAIVDYFFKIANIPLPYITNFRGDDKIRYMDVVNDSIEKADDGIFRDYIVERLLERVKDLAETEPSVREEMEDLEADLAEYLVTIKNAA